MKILITGSMGQLGRELNKQLKGIENIELINTEVQSEDSHKIGALDITDQEEVINTVKGLKPDVIINCAAHTAVDLCETDDDNALRINGEGPKNLAMAAEMVAAKLIHISTDYVFDGNVTRPYTEEDKVNPQSVYGTTKLAGEKYVQQHCSRYFIVRTAWLYGDGKNFVKTMLRLAETNKEIKVVCDQYGTPTSTKELAGMIIYLINKDNYGVYHGTCEGSATWYEFALEIFKDAGVDIKVLPITTEEYIATAKRPTYGVLENQKLKILGGYEFKHWKDALADYLKNS